MDQPKWDRPDLAEYITIKEAAELLSRKPSTVRRLIRENELEAAIVNGQVKVSKRSVEYRLLPRPYVPTRPAPKCVGWNDKLKKELEDKGTYKQ